MSKIWKQYYDHSPFLEGIASISLFGQGSSFKNIQHEQSQNNEISRCFSEVAKYLNQSMEIFAGKYVRK